MNFIFSALPAYAAICKQDVFFISISLRFAYLSINNYRLSEFSHAAA